MIGSIATTFFCSSFVTAPHESGTPHGKKKTKREGKGVFVVVIVINVAIGRDNGGGEGNQSWQLCQEEDRQE